MEPNVEFWVYFSHSDSMKECLYVMLLKESELRQWLIYFLSHTAASNHCSTELLTHPSIMLSRHIISACVCVFVCPYTCVIFFFFFFEGALKAGVKKMPVWTFWFVSSQDLKTVRAFTSELRPRRVSKWNAFSLQPVAWSHIVSQRRSHSNVWTSLPLPGPERQMKFSAWTKLQRHISLVFTGSDYQCLYMIYQYESLQSLMCTLMTGLDLYV